MSTRGRIAGSSLNGEGKFRCPSCSSSFKRPEHMRRHQRCHEGIKQFSCSQCGKRFGRSDVLARHCAVHERQSQPETGQSIDALSSKRRRACVECARAREKCTKTSPCRRCSARSLLCVFPDKERQTFQGDETSPRVPTEDNVQPSLSMFSGDQARHEVVSPQLRVEDAVPGATRFPYIQESTMETINQIDVAYHPSSMAPSSNMVMTGVPYQSGSSSSGFPDPAYPQERPSRPSTQLYEVQQSFPMTNGWAGVSPALYGDMEFPMNWLPTNDSIDIDYNSFLGLSFSPPAFPSADGGLILEQNASSLESPGTRSIRASLTHPTASPEAVSSIASPSSLILVPASAVHGGFYATSTNGARAPCTVRSRRRAPSAGMHNCSLLLPVAEGKCLGEGEDSSFSFPDIHHVSFDDSVFQGMTPKVQDAVYQGIYKSFRELCLTPHELHNAYSSASFPSIDHFNLFINLFFSYFAPNLPIIHEPSFDVNEHRLLVLAIVSIGCQYTQTQEFGCCVAPFHEFLRRALVAEFEKAEHIPSQVRLVQALVLSQVGMLYCGDQRLHSIAKRRHGELVNLVKFDNLLDPSSQELHVSADTRDGRSRWSRWIASETRRRVGYAIWLLDCMMAYHFGIEPMLSLATAMADLPHDELWGASGPQEWAEVNRKATRNPSLCSAVQRIIRDKEVKVDIGEFSRIILLHGVYGEIFQIKDYFKRPLSSWVPAVQPTQVHPKNDHDQRQSRDEENRNRWLLSVPEFARWRNVALDCVDALHWAANATIAFLSGAEHPTVMHLHLARTVLLVPFDEIITLALSVGAPFRTRLVQDRTPLKQEAIAAEREVLQWAQRDESKARLAALHCGCFYWHIRRYSTMAFYEPVSVFLATLSLWAYSYYTSKATDRQKKDATAEEGGSSASASRQQSPGQMEDTSGGLSSGNSTAPYGDGDPDPTFVRLDRPCDDEMVQLFVRSGRPPKMKAYITGVGDICAAEGPVRILREGRKILQKVSFAWARTTRYYDILESLEQAIMSRRQA